MMSHAPSFSLNDLSSLLKQNVLLTYAADLAVYPKADHVVVKAGVSSLQMPADTLAVLDAFRSPTSMPEALRRLQPLFATRADWLRVMETITGLIKLGGLVPAQQTDNQPPPPTLALHRLLLRDEYRTLSYLEGLRAVVQPTDIVLDIGTGSGVLAAGAALAGARHVYAVEAGSMAKTARRIFEANGLADRITVIEGWSTEIELPERADVLVSEIISNGVFGQNILNVTRDAWRRLLKPNAHVIPNRVRLYGMLAEISAEWLGRHQFTAGQIAHWRGLYGIDFSPLLEAQSVSPLEEVTGSTAGEWTYLSDPVLLADLDLTHIDSASVETVTDVYTRVGGTVNGLVLFFEADLTPERTITTYHGAPERPFAWANPVVLFDAAQVSAGQGFTLTLVHGESDPLGYAVALRRHD
jgi:precorrin-6B methylase 2